MKSCSTASVRLLTVEVMPASNYQLVIVSAWVLYNSRKLILVLQTLAVLDVQVSLMARIPYSFKHSVIIHSTIIQTQSYLTTRGRYIFIYFEVWIYMRLYICFFITVEPPWITLSLPIFALPVRKKSLIAQIILITCLYILWRNKNLRYSDI